MDVIYERTLLIRVTSSKGPAMRLVPVSAMAWQPDAQNESDPMTTESILNCQ